MAASGVILMLVLMRRVGESIRIGDDIIVTIKGAKGTHVRLGIDAPKQVQVWRAELYEEVKANPEGRKKR